MNKTLYTFAGAAILMAAACSSDSGPIDGWTDEIASVENGNTVVLKGGVTVQLLGLKAGSNSAQEELGKYIGHEITLKADSYDNKQDIEGSDDVVRAYARLTDSGLSLNRLLISAGGAKSFSPEFVKDSLVAFAGIWPAEPERPSLEKISKDLHKATIYVTYTSAGCDTMYNSTGFILNKDGLAVVDGWAASYSRPGTKYEFFLNDEEGYPDFEHPVSLKSKVYSDYKPGKPNFGLIYLDLTDDDKNKISYLTLTDRPLRAGQQLHTLGNTLTPTPFGTKKRMPMLFRDGTVSSTQTDGAGRFVVNMAMPAGFTGGALVDEFGQVVGVNSLGFEESNANLHYGVDINCVMEVLDQMGLTYSKF